VGVVNDVYVIQMYEGEQNVCMLHVQAHRGRQKHGGRSPTVAISMNIPLRQILDA